MRAWRWSAKHGDVSKRGHDLGRVTKRQEQSQQLSIAPGASATFQERCAGAQYCRGLERGTAAEAPGLKQENIIVTEADAKQFWDEALTMRGRVDVLKALHLQASLYDKDFEDLPAGVQTLLVHGWQDGTLPPFNRKQDK